MLENKQSFRPPFEPYFMAGKKGGNRPLRDSTLNPPVLSISILAKAVLSRQNHQCLPQWCFYHQGSNELIVIDIKRVFNSLIFATIFFSLK